MNATGNRQSGKLGVVDMLLDPIKQDNRGHLKKQK